MKVDLLCSGSKGNSCLVRTSKGSIVIDCGSTKKYLMASLQSVSQDLHALDALLVTHGHKDHISQLKHFDHLPVYSYCDLETSDHRTIAPLEQFMIQDMKITVIGLSHDAPNTVGYVIEDEKEKLVYITDTGYLPNHEKQYLENADHYIFESNHDMEMLMNTSRPMFVKQRILSDSGHLSNEDSSHHLTSLINSKTKNIVLAHLSQEANVPELALDVLADTFLKKDLRSAGICIQAAPQFGIVSLGENNENLSFEKE